LAYIYIILTHLERYNNSLSLRQIKIISFEDEILNGSNQTGGYMTKCTTALVFHLRMKCTTYEVVYLQAELLE